jgi:hypothetical protein
MFPGLVKKELKASPNPFPVYRYSNSLENIVGFMEVVRRRNVGGAMEAQQ